MLETTIDLPRRGLLVHAGTAVAAAGAGSVYWFAGPDVRATVYAVVVALPVLTFGVALRSRQGADRRPWAIAVLGLLLLLAIPVLAPGWLAGGHLGQAEGSLVDVTMWAAHGLFLTGTAMALRRRAATDPGGLIDAALFGLCSGGPLWVWVVQPHLPAGATAVGQIMLLADVLVLCGVTAGLLRIGAAGRPGRPTLAYLLLTSLLTLAAMVVATLSPGNVWSAELLLGAFLTIAAAPIHPSAKAITRPLPAAGPVTSRPRLGWLAAALSVNPLILTVQAVRVEE